mgnify:FL=1
MPFTAFMTLMGALTMLGCWYFIGQRISRSTKAVSKQVRLLHNFFLHFGIFTVLIFLPHILLSLDPGKFPIAMAWGYVIGHVFLYIALIQIIRMTFSMVPRLVNKERYAIIFGVVATILVTALNIQTMVFGTLPEYDYEQQVTIFNAAPVVGAAIGLFAISGLLPATVLLFRNGHHNPDARLRSYLLGVGFLILMTAGPLHDVARSGELYVIADVVSIFGLVCVTAGVVYRLEERITTVTASSRSM